MKDLKVIVKRKGTVVLDRNDYKGSGGEGTVYCKNGLGYKIYHDCKKIIDPRKIEELREIKLKNVLAPIDVIFDTTNKPIGFTMPFVKNTEFLCKLFTKSFLDRNTISPQMIADLVKEMQKTLIEIHRDNILVVDYNEMNFLTDSKFAIPYHIDVDSYQTQHFPATALMESVRDHHSQKNKFSELTDWFSFAIVTFQLYIGVHPYKGRHPKYSPKEISQLKMMEDDISVFHKDVHLPINCRDLSVIPKPHLEWYRKVFLNNERSIPPFPDQIQITIVEPKIIFSNQSFNIEVIDTYPYQIKRVRYFNGIRYVITEKKIYANKMEYCSIRKKAELCNVEGNYPVVVYQDDKKIIFESKTGNEIGTIDAENVMSFNGLIYTVNNGKLIENQCTVFGKKIVHHTQVVSEIFASAYKCFEGVIIQDVLGRCIMAIPYIRGTCATVEAKELDGYRIIDAKFESGHTSNICIVIAEKNGKYYRFIFSFNENLSSYELRRDDDVDVDVVNFTVKSNGLCITIINDLKVEAFFNINKVKVINDPPFDSSMRIFEGENKTMFINENKLQTASLK